MSGAKKRDAPAGNRGRSPKRSTRASEAKANGTDRLPGRVAKVVGKGWRVLPQSSDKAALIKWREFQERPPTNAELAGWADDFPNCMWAVMTGQASGVLVFDFDGDEGMATLRSLDLTPAITTPSGGAHVYTYAPDYAVRGAARVDPEQFPNMDLRADGQLATFYGINRLRGGSYEKVKGGKIYRHEDLPVDLQRLLVDRKKSKAKAPAELPDNFEDFADADVLLREAVELVKDSGASRNHAGFHLACQLRDERTAFEDAEAAMVRFVAAVTEAGEHVYTDQEAYNSLVSAYSSEPREPRAMGKYKVGDGFANTDYGNAERLVDRHGEDLRFCNVWGQWLTWDGRRWERDGTGSVDRLAKDTVRNILRSAADVENSESRLTLTKWARASESSARLRSMINLAQSEEAVAVRADAFDSDPYLLNVENGTLDLRTGTLHDHRRTDMATKLAPVPYDDAAPAPRWERFLRQVLPDDDLRQFVQAAVGYSLTGLTNEHVAFVLYGSGANGKSTFVETVRAVLGDYAQQAPSDLLMAKRGGGIPNDVARLQGARYVTTTETDEGRHLAESLFKQLTGGDQISARYLYGEFFDFKPQAKFWIATNHKPEVRSVGEAMWRRIRLVPFTVTVPEADRDGRLPAHLWRERAGVLRWAVEGALMWQREGLRIPAVVQAATDEYRQEMDVLGQFLEECCVVEPGREVAARTLYDRFQIWARDQGYAQPWTQKRFGTALGDRGFEKYRKGTNKVHTWIGLEVHGGGQRVPLVSVK